MLSTAVRTVTCTDQSGFGLESWVLFEMQEIILASRDGPRSDTEKNKQQGPLSVSGAVYFPERRRGCALGCCDSLSPLGGWFSIWNRSPLFSVLLPINPHVKTSK